MASSAPGAPQCLLFTVPFDGIEITDPLIIPTSVLAFLIGSLCGWKLLKTQGVFHAFPFFGFAIMMSEAGLVHTLGRYFSPFHQLLLWWIDAGLTSSIALAFGFIGAQDVGWVSQTPKFFALFLALDIPIWVGWLVAFLKPAIANTAFLVLYIGVILVCCGFFSLVQLVFIARGKFSGGVAPLLVAVVAGYVGVRTTKLCSWPVPQISGEVWWFLLSDISMFFVYKYFQSRK